MLSEAKDPRDIVKASRQVVQMGTQHRSQPYPLAVRDIIRSGKIGKVVHIEQEWNVNEERWRFTPMDTGINREMLKDESMEWKSWLYGRKSQLREEDTDWKRWLLASLTALSILTFIWSSDFTRIFLRASSTRVEPRIPTWCICGPMRLTPRA